MKRSDSIASLAAALAKAQGTMKGASKDSSNPFFKSSYADLASCWDSCRTALSANGLCIVQTPTTDAQGVCVETLLAHASGEWISDVLTIPVNKRDAQGVGSAITYARRYALSSFVGVAPEDDDGNSASRSPGHQENHEQNGAADPEAATANVPAKEPAQHARRINENDVAAIRERLVKLEVVESLGVKWASKGRTDVLEDLTPQEGSFLWDAYRPK